MAALSNDSTLYSQLLKASQQLQGKKQERDAAAQTGQKAGASPIQQTATGAAATLGSGTVNQARQYLQGAVSGNSSYQSSYTGQIADLYDQIMNRPKFSYDPNQDPLYHAYRDQYTRNGQLAMRDAMGTAAGLTGGYGNSWGETAGFQAYQQYLQGLNDVLPQLEEKAYGRYQDEGNEALQKLALAREWTEDDYSQYAQRLSDWMNGAAAKQNAEQSEQRKNDGGKNPLDSLMVADADQNQMLLDQLETLSRKSNQGKKGEKKKGQARALIDLAKEMAKSDSGGRVDSKLGWAALRAAKEMLENRKT